VHDQDQQASANTEIEGEKEPIEEVKNGKDEVLTLASIDREKEREALLRSGGMSDCYSVFLFLFFLFLSFHCFLFIVYLFDCILEFVVLCCLIV
jgi:hypothetical protein